MQSVLIVEDTPHLMAWLSQVVSDTFADAQIQACDTRAKALATLAQQRFDLALVDLGLPDGSGLDVIEVLRDRQSECTCVVVTIFDDDDHLFGSLKAGAFGYLLKDQEQHTLKAQLLRIVQGEPPLTPSIARRVLGYFTQAASRRATLAQSIEAAVALTERETEVLGLVAKGLTLGEIAKMLGISRYTVADYVKTIYKKLNVSSRAEAALEAVRRGLVGYGLAGSKSA
jgi:DNA-binding NarL/FixJ family response regulator